MNVHSIQDLTNSKIIEILSNGLQLVTEEHLLKNYHPNYRDDPANLFYILNQGRYKIGKYYIITDSNNKYIASAGWNEYSEEIALCLTRMYVSSNYRSNFIIAKVLFPFILTETEQYKKLWMTVNEYNKSLYNWFVRNQKINSIGNWPKIYKKFKPIGTRTVNHSIQYVVEYDKSKENN